VAATANPTQPTPAREDRCNLYQCVGP